jgi:hypothetical protein
MSRPWLASTARHEAGHAVATWHLARAGFHRWKPASKVTRVLIRPDGSGVCEVDRCGVYFEHGRPVDPSTMPGPVRHLFGGWTRRDLIADLVVIMAGPLATSSLAGVTFPDFAAFFDALPDHLDKRKIRERTAWLYDRRHVALAFRFAGRIVRERRRHIEAVAAELLAHGALEGADFAAICAAVEEDRWP